MDETAAAPGKKILPPVYFLGAILLMIALHHALPLRSWEIRPWNLAGILLILLGVAGAIVANIQFHRHGTCTQHQHRVRQVAQFQHVVAGQEPGLLQSRYRGVGDHRTGGNDEGFRRIRLPTGLNFVGRDELGFLFDQGEARILELFDAVGGEVVDEPVLAVDDGAEVSFDVVGEQAELFRAPHEGDHVRRAQDGFGGHAPAQDAESAQRAGIENGDACTFALGGVGRGIARRPPANHDHIKIHG